jgi:hypothetical protein
MKHDLGMHLVMHLVFFGKTGMTIDLSETNLLGHPCIIQGVYMLLSYFYHYHYETQQLIPV